MNSEELQAEIERFDDRGDTIRFTSPELFSDKQNYPEPKSYIDTTPEVEMPKDGRIIKMHCESCHSNMFIVDHHEGGGVVTCAKCCEASHATDNS